MKINYAEIRREITDQKKERVVDKSVVNDDKSSAIAKSKVGTTNKSRTSPKFVDFKWMLSALGTIAAFYNSAGYQVKSEQMYVKYV